MCPDPPKEDLDLLVSQQKTFKGIWGFNNQLTLKVHEEGMSDEQIVKYVRQFGFYPENRLRQLLKFIRDPLWATYQFTYSIGRKLIENKFGLRPSTENFTKLLTSPILHSDLK